MEEHRSHADSVSSCQCKYHFVWCPKCRHPVLDVVEDDVRELFAETAETADHFGPLRTRDSGVGDRGRRRPRTLVCAHRPKTQSGGHRSAIQVVFG